MYFRNVWKKYLAVLLGTGSLWANPLSPVVVAGTATFSTPNPSTLRINASNGTIIEWQSFSINLGEITKFIQPGAGAAVLNRVTGASPSSLLGALQANGKIVLINQNGILVSATGLINTSNFIGSTLDVSNSEFLAGGDMNFAGPSIAQVSNAGSVNGWSDNAILIGYSVSHQGELNAPLGAAAVGSGIHVLVKASGPDKIIINPMMSPPPPSGNGISVSSTGLIEAVQAELKADGNLYAMAINLMGEVDASGIDMMDGKIILSAQGGTTQLNGGLFAGNADGTGGEIQVLGDTVQLGSSAVADVSGYNGGGQILIGGNIPEAGPAVYNSTQTTVDSGAVLNASAFANGNGGTVTIWSDQAASFHGSASAEGGSVGGNGGSVNVGGKSTLQITGNGSTLALFGAIGSMAIGASNIDVRAGQLPNPPANTVDASYLADNLSRNAVTLLTRAGAPGTMDIVFYDPLAWSSPTPLYLQAAHDIQFGSDIDYTGGSPSGFLSATSSNDLSMHPSASMAFSFPSSSLSFYSGHDQTLLGGTLNGGSVSVSADAILFQAGRNLNVTGGSANGSFVEITGSTSCEFDTGGVTPGGFLNVQAGTAAAADVHIPKATITSSGTP